MRVLILADRSFARREAAMLSRLEIGLADEGVRVVHAVPEHCLTSEAASVYSSVVGFDDTGWAWTRSRRAARLISALQGLDLVDAQAPIDVVHAFGDRAWSFALETARLAGAGVVLELCRGASISRAAAIAGNPSSSRASVRFVVSEPALGKALTKRIRTAPVALAPWGVHDPGMSRITTPRETPADVPLGVAMLSDTGDVRSVSAALSGLQAAMRSAGREYMVFLDVESATPARVAALWALTGKLGVRDRVSMTPQMEAKRQPVLGVDLLVLPEAGGRQRTLVLEAMVGGQLVVALADPFLESLVDGRTAAVVPKPTPEAWAARLRPLLTEVEPVRALQASAHAFVVSERTVYAHSAAILKAYAAVSGLTPVSTGEPSGAPR